MNRESYLLRQRAAARGDAGDAGDAAPLGSISVSPLDSDEQERVVAEIATDANNQSNLFTVSYYVAWNPSETFSLIFFSALLSSLLPPGVCGVSFLVLVLGDDLGIVERYDILPFF